MRKANGDHFNGSVGGHFKDQVSDVHFNGSAGVNSQGAHDDGPSVLAPTWSVRETRRQFEQMGTGPAMSNSFSGDLRHYKGRYAAPLAEAEKQRSADPNNVLSFDSIKLNEGHSTTGRRRSNDEHLNRYHPHNHPMSHNFQQAVQNQHVPNNGFNTVAQYYPKPAQSNDFSPLPPNSFQAPRLISQTNSVSASRPATYTSPPVTVHHPDYNNELRGHTAPDHPTSSNWSQSNDMHSRKTPEIRTVVAVPETDILDDSNHSEAEDDDIVATCADENHTKDDSINYEVATMSSSDEEDDINLRNQVEREEIVDRYEKGADDIDNVIHAEQNWENPDFELYEKTDRYGFIHKNNLQPDKEKRDQERERRRCMKWDRMFREWEYRTPEKLKVRIWKGVPDSYRLKVWRKLLAIDEFIEKNGATTYQDLLLRGKLLSTEVRQIDVDVARTYRDHVMFMKRYDTSQQSVFNVLVAYSMYNTEIGYCQGMNNLAAILLMYLGEEEAAFWGLHSLVTNRKYSMHGFFIPGFPKLHRFEAHFEKVLLKYLPRLHRYMEREDIPRPYHAKWWFGIFVDRLPFSLAMRVWDVFLFAGDSILIAMAFNIMKMHQKDLIKAPLEVFMDIIQNRVAANFGYSNDVALESLRKCLEKLQDDRMALPPQPKKGETPELPVKPLGTILRRSMIDIRQDIAELHSRSSRTNSLAGRSPALKARRAVQQRNAMSPQLSSAPPNAPLNESTVSPLSQVAGARTPTGNQPPVRKTSIRNGRLNIAPPIPDSEGFIPMSNVRNRNSFYDNVTPGGSMAGSSVKHSREPSTNTTTSRVHSTANNVTYVELDGANNPPDSPTPDYEEAPDFGTALKQQLEQSPIRYQQDGQFRKR